MESLFAKYGYAPDKERIAKRLDAVAANIDNVTSSEVLKNCMSLMDLTTLRTEDTTESVKKLVEKVNAFMADYPEYPLPASICVYPNFASVVRENLAGKDVRVTAVAGCFPTSQSFVEVKVKECEMAVEAGADEIDIVLALNAFMAGDDDAARAEIRAIRAAIDEALKCKETGEEKTIVFGLTGTGYFDLVAYQKFNDHEMTDIIPTDEQLAASIAKLPKVSE